MLALALVSVACGAPATSTERAEDQATGARTSTNGGAGETIGSGPGCPARFGEQGPRCVDGDDPGACTYPEGVCACRTPVWCGGAAPPPMAQSWTCEPPRPACPAVGTPCSPGSPSCPTDACGFDRIACVDGIWQAQIGPRPP